MERAFKIRGFFDRLAGESNKKRAERIGKDKRKGQKNDKRRVFFEKYCNLCEFRYFCLEESNRSPHFTRPRRSFSQIAPSVKSRTGTRNA
jgi:hypothetical protein